MDLFSRSEILKVLKPYCSWFIHFYWDTYSMYTWLKEAALVLFSPICTSFCWTLTVTLSINTFPIRRGWSEVRPIHLHPFICLCSNGNKCVGGINRCIFLKLTSEQFVPNGNVFTGKESHFQRVHWILQLCGGEAHAFILELNKHSVCSQFYRA